jgi:hypothetical protein
MTKKIMDYVLWISIGLVAILAWFDSQQVIAMKTAGGQEVWDAFWSITSPAFFYTSLAIFFAIGAIWYLYSKDKSEALALFAVPSILIIFGVRDIIYYLISPDVLNESLGCWADVMTTVRVISDFLGEACPSSAALFISAGIGLVLAYYTYKYLKEAKW